jgi:hypothetical protein
MASRPDGHDRADAIRPRPLEDDPETVEPTSSDLPARASEWLPAVHRLGGVPGWPSAAPPLDRVRYVGVGMR